MSSHHGRSTTQDGSEGGKEGGAGGTACTGYMCRQCSLPPAPFSRTWSRAGQKQKYSRLADGFGCADDVGCQGRTSLSLSCLGQSQGQSQASLRRRNIAPAVIIGRAHPWKAEPCSWSRKQARGRPPTPSHTRPLFLTPPAVTSAIILVCRTGTSNSSSGERSSLDRTDTRALPPSSSLTRQTGGLREQVKRSPSRRPRPSTSSPSLLFTYPHSDTTTHHCSLYCRSLRPVS
jgi:hypothetical protein